MTVSDARKKADELLALHHVEDAPVDVESLAKKSGLQVIRDRLGDDDVSGLLVCSPAGSYVVVQQLDSRKRQRFTIAHELAHFLLKHQFEPGEHVHVDRGNFISQRGPRAAQGIDPAP